MKNILHMFTNTGLLGVLLLVLLLPVGMSVFITNVRPEAERNTAFEVRSPSRDYGEFLSYGDVAGGRAETLTLKYTAFSGFVAYYDSVYVVENTQDTMQRFRIKLVDEREDLRMFFAGLGEESGPDEMVLAPGESAAITLAVDPVQGETSETGTLSFVVQSLPVR